jgi:hypothetical protein
MLMYGYVEPSVEKVTLEIPQGDPNGIQNVVYKLKLHYIDYLKWKSLEKANSISNPLLKKATILSLVKLGAPIGLKERIIERAKEYLPAAFGVEVQVVNE